MITFLYRTLPILYDGLRWLISGNGFISKEFLINSTFNLIRSDLHTFDTNWFSKNYWFLSNKSNSENNVEKRFLGFLKSQKAIRNKIMGLSLSNLLKISCRW